MSKDLVNDLFKFIRSDESTSFAKLKEASDAAYSGVDKESSDIMEDSAELLKRDVFTSRMPQVEGKLPADPSVATPDQIQPLAEEKDEKKEEKSDIKTANAGVTETPEKGPLQKKMDKETPDVDTKSDFKVAAGMKKDEKKSDVKVTGVEKKEDKKTDEGKLPADPSVATPDQIQTLAEERCLVTISDESTAKGIASKYSGGRVVQDSQGKQWMVMVPDGSVQEKTIKEETTTEPKGAAISAKEVPEVKDEKDSVLKNVSKADPKDGAIKSAEANVGKSPKDPQVGDKGESTAKQSAPTDQKIDVGSAAVANQDAAKVSGGNPTTEPEKAAIKDVNSVAGTDAKKEDKLTPESKIKEDAEVSVTSDGQTATVSISAEGGVNVATSAAPAAEAPAEVPAELPVSTETPAEEEAEVKEEGAEADEEEAELKDEEAEEMAERIYVSDYLSTLGEAKLTEKQKAFVAETKSKKMSKKNKEKVDAKLKSLRSKKDKK
jgi:hypothetical protein